MPDTLDLERFFAAVPSGSALSRALPEGVSVTFVLSGDDGGTWTVRRTGDGADVTRDEAHPPDCALRCTTQDFRALLRGKLEPRRGFLDGRLDVAGDVGLVLRLHRLLPRGAA
jgi:putative sterol carrier protein